MWFLNFLNRIRIAIFTIPIFCHFLLFHIISFFRSMRDCQSCFCASSAWSTWSPPPSYSDTWPSARGDDLPARKYIARLVQVHGHILCKIIWSLVMGGGWGIRSERLCWILPPFSPVYATWKWVKTSRTNSKDTLGNILCHSILNLYLVYVPGPS